MVLIADAHVSEARGNVQEFTDMLTRIGDSSHDVVFLGDILDLWIALPRYESSLHAGFVDWCRRECERRTVGLVEGNHEFFVARHHAEAFSFVSRREYLDGAGRLFVHGDTVNRRDWAYRALRLATKNPFTRLLERIVPRGPALVRNVKRYLNNRRRGVAKTFPEEALRTFCRDAYASGASVVYMGHFHDHRVLDGPDGRRCEIVPAWKTEGRVLVVESYDSCGAVTHWRDI